MTVFQPDVKQTAVVRHPKFGQGKVVARYGEDEKSKVIVKFVEEGEKKLAIKYAKLIVDLPEPEVAPESTIIPASEA